MTEPRFDEPEGSPEPLYWKHRAQEAEALLAKAQWIFRLGLAAIISATISLTLTAILLWRYYSIG